MAGHGPPRSSNRARLGGALAMLLLALLSALTAGSDARATSNGRGPLALARVKVDQHKQKGSIKFSGRHDLPPLRTLRRFPSEIGSEQRHLCVAADGKAIKKRLFCVGGRSRKGKVRVGISRYRDRGTTRKLGSFMARLERPSDRAVKLRFKLSRAGFETGRFRYWGLSAWHGPECAPPEPPGPNGGGGAGTARDDVCHSRAPRTGTEKGRIYKLVPAGCTTGNRGAYRNGSRRHKRVALTFDDGPSPYTTEILHSLDKMDAKGTFFEVGNQMSGYAGVMRKIIAHGHEIGNHSYAHEQYPSSSSMAATSARIEKATGFKPCDFRPPYGAYNGSTVDSARRNGLSVALWDIDTQDYTLPGSGTIYSRAVQAGKGSIVLMHDGGGNRSQTAAAVPDIIRTLRERGYKLVTVTELLGGHFRLREKHRRPARQLSGPRPLLLVPGGEDPRALGADGHRELEVRGE